MALCCVCQTSECSLSLKTTPYKFEINSYHLFDYADAGINSHAAPPYEARLAAKHCVVKPNAGKIIYPWQKGRGDEFVTCWHDKCLMLKSNESDNRSYHGVRGSGRLSRSPPWHHQWRSYIFLAHVNDAQRWDNCLAKPISRKGRYRVWVVCIYTYLYIHTYMTENHM